LAGSSSLLGRRTIPAGRCRRRPTRLADGSSEE
jgi:hypothetical protein